MTAYEQKVRDELQRLAQARVDGAAEALKGLDPEKLAERHRAGVLVQDAIVELIAPRVT